MTDTLEQEGIQKFADPFHELLEEIERKSKHLVVRYQALGSRYFLMPET